MSKQSKLLPYQERVVVEHQELGIKINKLDTFMASDAFRALSDRERETLRQQQRAMWDYCGALGDRIEDFGVAPPFPDEPEKNLDPSESPPPAE